MNKRISSTLLYLTRSVSLRYHVNLSAKGRDGVIDIPNAFHTDFENGHGKYINYDVFAYITLDIKEKSEYWDKSKSIMLTPRNLFQFLTHLSKAISNIYEDDCFFEDTDGNTRLNLDTVEKYTVRGFNLGQNQRVVIQPATVYESVENDIYEGAMFSLNNSNNYFSIPIDVMETMYYILSKVDFMVYTGVMLNYYFHRILTEEDDEQVVDTTNKTHVFSRVTVEDIPIKDVEESQTKSTIVKEQNPKEFFEM